MTDAGDIAFVLICSALVMFMTPGLALFYGGMVRNKNVLGTIMQSLILVGLVTVIWVLWGYSIAVGPDVAGIFGSLDWFGLKGVGLCPSPDYARSIPHTVAILKILDWTMGLKVSDEEEVRGLDITQHSETAYSL